MVAELFEPLVQRNRFRRIDISGPVSLGDTLGAVADETAATNPLEAAGRMTELRGAREGEISPFMAMGGVEMRRPPESPELADEEQARRIEAAGLTGRLTPVPGETEEGLGLRVRWKRDEIQRQAMMANADPGVGTTAAQFGTAMVVSLFDPINVASGFVPVVGPARYASMLSRRSSRLGRFAVRSRVGALEGAAGAAMVEPLVLASTHMQQADYDLYDSFFNLAVGSSIGGGLHGIGGAIGDAVQTRRMAAVIDSVSSDTRARAFESSVGALLEGRPVRAPEHLLRADLEASTALATAGVGIPGGRVAIRNLETFAPHAAAEGAQGGGRVFVPAVDAGGPLTFASRAEADRKATELRRQGNEVRVRRVDDDQVRVELGVGTERFVRDDDGELLTFRKKASATKRINRLKKEGRIEAGAVVKVGDEHLITTESDPVRLASLRANADQLEFPVEIPREALRMPDAPALRAEAEASFQPENAIMAAQERQLAERIVEPQRPDAANDDVAGIESAIAAIEAETERVLRELGDDVADAGGEADAAAANLEKARSYGNGLRQAAACVIGAFF